MTRQAEAIQQRQLRQAAHEFFEALPPMHRELVALMAADSGKEPYQVIAAALVEAIARYRETLGTQMHRRF